MSLTPREIQVLAAMAEGHSIKTAARAFGIEFHTIKTHLAHIHTKLGCRTTCAAIAWAMRAGLLR